MVVLCVRATTTHGTDRSSSNNNNLKNMMDDFTGKVVKGIHLRVFSALRPVSIEFGAKPVSVLRSV
jgi:hypothetical protein